MFKDKLVLIIDDSDTIRSYLKSILSPLGAQVEGAATGQEGMDMCASAQYDLILLDLILPDMDGIEVLQRIREKNMSSAIVMVTGYGGIKSAIAAAQLGADGYLQKQEMTVTVHDHSEFLYALEQAFDRRAGLVAKKQLEDMRADFYAMITHDLRNPAGVILAATDLLKEDEARSLSHQQQELVSIIHAAATKLTGLANDYLDLAKIDAGYLRLDRDQVELREVVLASAQFARLQAQAKRQTLDLDLPRDPVVAYADAERLKQVLDNLLSNAIKYTPGGGRITVQLRVEDEQAVFCVSDTGMGVPLEQMPRLFAKYHRVPGEARRGIQGTGLGLLIVKEIVEAHGGSIRAESEGVPGKGTRFVITVPLEQAAAPEQAQTVQPSAPSNGEDVELYQGFVHESLGHIRALQDLFDQLPHAPQDRQLIESAQRITHTLKGNAGAMQFTAICDLATRMDDVLRRAKQGDLILTSVHVAGMSQLLDRIAQTLANKQ